MDRPRNLLFIVADQFRADLLKGSLAAAVETSNLDRLARRSEVYLDHHTVTVPCGPARASLLTGQYAMTHRVTHNGAPLGHRHPNLASELRKLGLEPLLFGYNDVQPDPSGLHRNDPAHRSYTQPLRGFTEVQEMRDEAWSWLAHLRSRGYDVPDAESDDFDALYRPLDGILGNPALYHAEDSDTAFLTDRVIWQLDVRKSRPWAAMVNYIRPHPPLVAPAPYHALIPTEAVPKPVQNATDHPFFSAFHSAPTGNGLFYGFNGRMDALLPDTTALLRRTYLGLVEELDHHIGRLLDWLEATDQSDNTMVIFTADHAEMLGDLGTWGKITPFRQASHIPLIVQSPGGPDREVDNLTRSIDVVPTILETFGAEIPNQMAGRPLRSQEPSEDIEPVSDAAMLDGVMIEVELGGPDGAGRFESAWDQPMHACRAAIWQTTAYRYVHFACDQPPMLFDTKTDPSCTTDIALERADLVTELQRGLLNHRIQNAAVEF